MVYLEKYRKIILSELRKTDKKKYCFIGAGISTISNIPNWDELIKHMGFYLKQRSNDDSLIERFNYELERKDYPNAANLFKSSSLSFKEKHDFFRQEFIENKECKSIHHSLVKLPFDGIFTTNYDHLIEDAYAYVYGKSLVPYTPLHWKDNDLFEFPNSFFIAKLHGDINDWSSIVLDLESYKKGNWVDMLERKIQNSVIFIFGVGGYDYYVNEFILRSPNTNKIYLFMLQESGLEFKRNANAFKNLEFRNNIELINDLSKKEIELMILGLGNRYDVENLKDSPWGEMPISIFKLDYGESAIKMRDFFFSSSRIAVIKSKPGYGLSSFLSQALRDRANSRNVLIFRLEGKEYLPLEAYIYHIVNQLFYIDQDAYSTFIKMRKKAAMGWNEEDEAMALAEAFNVLNRPVIIAIEHIDRIFERVSKNVIVKFVNVLLSRTSDSDVLKLIFALSDTVKSFKINTQPFSSVYINIDSISPDSCKILCEQKYGIESKIIQSILDVNINADVNTIALAAFLITINQVPFNSKMRDLILKCDHEELCRKLLAKNKKNRKFIEVLKVSCLLRTPRSLDDIIYCSSVKSRDELKDIISKIVHLGLLMPNHSGEKWSMSTSIRRALYKILMEPCEKNEINAYLSKIGDYYRDKIDFQEDINEENEKIIHHAIPSIATSLYYYKAANNLTEYYKTILLIKKHLINNYHYNLIEKWLEDAPAGSIHDDYKLEFEIICIKMRISLIRSLPGKFESELRNAKQLLNRVYKEKLRFPNIDNEIKKLDYYEGILHTLRRNYRNALKKFNQISVKHNEIKSKMDYKILLRVIQTNLSLGNIKKAETRLNSLEKILNASSIPVEEKTHHLAMINRHHATINIIRLQQLKLNPSSKTDSEKLVKSALIYADACINFSQKLNDYTGVGLGLLKKGQTYYAAEQYDRVSDFASEAIDFFVSFPNNRWWIITCHDLIAKAESFKGNFKEAQSHLTIAQSIWSNSSGEDNLRKCELYYTDGLISYHKGDLPTSFNLFKESINFNHVESPCIYKMHLHKLIDVAANLGRYEEVKKLIDEFQIMKEPVV